MLKWVFLGLLGLPIWAMSAQIEFNSQDSDQFKNSVVEAYLFLPSTYLEKIPGKVKFSLAAFKSDEDLTEICDEKEKRWAETRKRGNDHEITISSRLFELASSDDKKFDCLHGGYKNLLKATVIHELTHVKDNFEHISTDANFQRIVGMKKVQDNSKSHLMNLNSSSSPDAYEFENLEEALAVNTEYLALDPEFECRKPATATFLAKRLGLPLMGKCEKNYQVMIQSSYSEDNYLQTINIDPSRVYQVHYLFASKGEQMMSRWGHAMFRLIVCAPTRQTVGPECMEDVSHHLALSYRANVTEIQMDSMRGAFGKYPSQLFIMRFLEVQQEYSKSQFRDLFSVPLKLTDAQKTEFIDTTLERFWTYQGKYYFFDNNCGTESLKQLAIVLSDDQSKLIHSITPLKMYNDIIKSKNDLTVENLEGLKRDELIAKGIVTKSMFDSFNEGYQEIRKTGIFGEKDFRKFVKKTKAVERLTAYGKYFNTTQPEDKVRKLLVLRILQLERYLAAKFMMELPKKAVKVMDKDPGVKEELEKLGSNYQTLNLQPWQVVLPVYGVPLKEEFNSQYPAFKTSRQEKLQDSIKSQVANIEGILNKTSFAEELKELEALKQISKFTNQIFREVSGLQ